MKNAIPIVNYEYYDAYNGISIASLIMLLALVFEVFILALRRAFKKEVYPAGYKQMYLPCDFCMAIMRYIIDFSLKIGILGLALFMAWKSYEFWNWFKAATNLDCADGNREMINFVISPYS